MANTARKESARRALAAYAKIDAIARYKAELWACAHHAADMRLGRPVPKTYLHDMQTLFFQDTRTRWCRRMADAADACAQAELEAEYAHAEAFRNRWRARIREQQALTAEIIDVQLRMQLAKNQAESRWQARIQQ